MKKLYSLVLAFLISCSIFAQLNADHNSLRVGDVIVKQQVQFKDPGKVTANAVWDFSQLELINDEYELIYTEAPLLGDSVYVMGYNQFDKKVSKYADLIVGTEHNTMYYYYQTLDSLVLLGHENVAIKQENLKPITNLLFPLGYGQKTSSNYLTRGLYSGVTHVKSEGQISMHADAYGMMILPSGDTINPVLRVNTEQTIFDTSENLIAEIENDKGRLLRSYKWYSKGYRYPIFETVECINLNDNENLFETAFFFPPQEHLYLDTDPENLALLDKLWDFTEVDNAFKHTNLFADGNKKNTYRIYPNPVKDILTIEYTLEKDSPVNIIMPTVDGKVVKNIYKKMQPAGEQHEQIDCSGFVAGAYLLKVVSGEVVINEKILKR